MIIGVLFVGGFLTGGGRSGGEDKLPIIQKSTSVSEITQEPPISLDEIEPSEGESFSSPAPTDKTESTPEPKKKRRKNAKT